MSELYHVLVIRRGLAHQIQLNYTSKAAAEEAFETLSKLEQRIGGVSPRLVLEDGFGAKVSFDYRDIGHVMFQDTGRTLEMQMISTLMQARAQAKANADAQRDPMIQRNGILVPANPWEVPH